MKKTVVVTAYLRDGETLTSDKQELNDAEFSETTELMCDLMKAEHGFLRLTMNDTMTVVVGRKDIMYVSVTEVEDGTQ